MKGAIIDPNASAFLVKMKPNPAEIMTGNIKHGYSAFTPRGSMSFVGTFIDGKYGEKFYKPPHAVGDMIYVKEKWLWVMIDHAHDLLEGRHEHNQYAFPDQFQNDWFDYAKEKYGYKWKSAQTMPVSAARHFRKVTKVEAVRVQDWVCAEQDATLREEKKNLVKSKLSLTEWYENHYVWLVTIEKTGK